MVSFSSTDTYVSETDPSWLVYTSHHQIQIQFQAQRREYRSQRAARFPATSLGCSAARFIGFLTDVELHRVVDVH